MKRFAFTAVLAALMLALAGTGYAAPAIEGKTVTYRAGGQTMKGFIAWDKSIQGKRPGVLIVHEWWGLNDYARMRARMIAELGYTALAVDMYGEGKQASHPKDAERFSSELMKRFETAKARFMAAYELLKKDPTVDPNRIAAVGYCFGGGVVLNMARQGADLRGVVSVHGDLTPVKQAERGSVKARVLVLQGGDDAFAPPEKVEAFKEEMKKAGADFRIIVYPGAKHSFSNPDADRYAKQYKIPLGYSAEADRQSWEDLKAFLAQVFAS